MLKEQQNKLKHKINIILKEIGHMNDIKKEIGEEFISKNLSAHRAMNVCLSREDLNTLTDSDDDIRFLFLFSFALDKAMKGKVDFSLDVKEYFTQLEYKQWINYREESEPENIYPIVFENVQQLADGMWQTIITAQQLANLDKNNLLLYNFKNQRNPKITVSGVRIDIDKAKVAKIKDRILNNKQFPDHVRFNILKDFTEEVYYNQKTQTLTINKGDINLIDGQHRKVANSLVIEEILEKNLEIDFNWGLVISNYTENDIKDFILQINEQKPFKKEQKEEWNLNKKENLIVSVIADNRISKLNKVMKSQESEIRTNKGLVTKNIIAEAIAENYELDDTTDIRGLGNWIVEFTDYLFSLYPQEFITNPYSFKDESVINHKNMFYGYIALSAKLYNNQDWRQLAIGKMESIDFSIDNERWEEMGLITSKVNKSLRNKLYKLFKE